MAIYHQFIAVVIPIKIIEKKCKHLGKLKGVLELNRQWIEKNSIDKYLYKDGAMGPGILKKLLDFG